MNTDALLVIPTHQTRHQLQKSQSPAHHLQTNAIDLSHENGTDSTTLQTPSPLTRLKQDLICKCGSTSFTPYKFRLNCKLCGVFAVQSQEGFVCGVNLKEDICSHGHALSAQERLDSLKHRQEPIDVADKIYRADALSLIQRGAQKFKMGSHTVWLAILYFDIVVAKHKDICQQIASTWQLHALTCLILACKFQERDDNVPLISELIRCLVGTQSARIVVRATSQAALSYDEVCRNEAEIMARLGWDLFRVTPLHFFENYCTQGLIMSSDAISVTLCDSEMQALQSYRSGGGQQSNHKSSSEAPVKVFRQPGRKTLQKVKRLTRTLLDLALEHTDMFNGLMPEALAISALMLARKACKLDESLLHIEQLLIYPSIQSDPDIQQCLKQMETLDDSTNSVLLVDSSTHLINTETKARQTINLLTATSHRTGRVEYTATQSATVLKKQQDSQLSMRLKQIQQKRDSIVSASSLTNLTSNQSRMSQPSLKQPQKSTSGRSAANFVLNLKTLQTHQKSAVNTSTSELKRHSVSKEAFKQRPPSEVKSATKTIQFRPQPLTAKNQSLVEQSSAAVKDQSSSKKPPLQQQIYLDLSKDQQQQQDQSTTARDKLFNLIQGGQNPKPEDQPVTQKQNFISKNIGYISKLQHDKSKSQMSQYASKSQTRYQSNERNTQDQQVLSASKPKFKVVLKQFQTNQNAANASSQQKLNSVASEYMPLTARSKQLQLQQQQLPRKVLMFPTQQQTTSQALVADRQQVKSTTRQRSVPRASATDTTVSSIKLGSGGKHKQKKLSIDQTNLTTNLAVQKQSKSTLLTKLVSPQATKETVAARSTTVLSSAHSSNTITQQQQATKSSKAQYMPVGGNPTTIKQSQQALSTRSSGGIKMLQKPPSSKQSALQQTVLSSAQKVQGARRVSSFLGDFAAHQSVLSSGIGLGSRQSASGSAQVKQPGQKLKAASSSVNVSVGSVKLHQ